MTTLEAEIVIPDTVQELLNLIGGDRIYLRVNGRNRQRDVLISQADARLAKLPRPGDRTFHRFEKMDVLASSGVQTYQVMITNLLSWHTLKETTRIPIAKGDILTLDLSLQWLAA